jgi:hypothetical protein
MKKSIKILMTATFGFLLFTAGAQDAPIDSTWTVRTDYITPAGLPDSAWVKEIRVVINLPMVPDLGSAQVGFGTTEGDSDLYYSEVNLSDGQPPTQTAISPEGWLVIPAGQFEIDPEHFYVATKLFDNNQQLLNP